MLSCTYPVATAARPVVSLIRHGGQHTMVDVGLADGTVIEATDRHPFWNAGTGAFEYAIDLEPGELVLTLNGSALEVTSVRVHEEDLTAYNLEIEGIHTYYAGDTPVLVHNTCGPSTWANPSTLDDHFSRHGADFGAESATQYADMASEFFVRAGADKLPTKIDAGGVIRIFDPISNAFGAFAPNGNTMTYFTANAGYWLRQVGTLQ